jgi:DNA modification methylase
LGNEYPKSKPARPRDVFRVTVGGGHLGSKLAHVNEAPFPEKLVEPFVRCLTKAGDTVGDPFCGSGTTAAVAKRLGRNFVGCDFRESEVELTCRRLAGITPLPSAIT